MKTNQLIDMCKLKNYRLALCTVAMALLGICHAGAFDVSKYATQSKLSTGKWVKISIPETGVYELTDADLLEMGFSNPANVRLYGTGGYGISEILNGKAVDDLKPVPVKRYPGKLCFYGNGPIKFTIASFRVVPHFVREFNSYSQVGCYFLTEETTPETQMGIRQTTTVVDYVDTPTGMNFFYHENELSSISGSGKDLLGEDFKDAPLLIDYYLPDLSDSTIVVSETLAARTPATTYAEGVLHSGGATDTTAFIMNMARIDAIPSDNDAVWYNSSSPYERLKLSHPAEHGQFEPYLLNPTDANVTISRLDHFTLTYFRDNIIREDMDNQMMMAYAMTSGKERYMLPNASSTTAVWCVYDVYAPTVVPLNTYNDASGQGLCFSTIAMTHVEFVAFDPAKTLKKVASFEPIANQNLHGMETPDLLIITHKDYQDQAERIADLHRSVDGIDVAVVDHEKIFNEFSSGTRDAMAYRLFCKMLYDRNPSKFKNLLLMGTGSMDNRELQGAHPGTLLTYQSANSNQQDQTFTTDDIFGFLGDNSGSDVTFEQLKIGVGRITCSDPEQARSDVDKLVKYYANPDYGVWRNNTMVVSDAPDRGEYMFQGEGYKNLIDNNLNTGMHVTTVHNIQFPRSNTQPNTLLDRKEANVGKQLMREQFKSGVFFATYVGHAGPIGFTKYNNMWVTSDVVNTDMPHLPIMSTACCNVARFDSGTCDIADLMFHYPNGGAIAMLTTSRMCYSTPNDRINTYFIRELFKRNAAGNSPTLGQAYMESKNAHNEPDNNKMKFFLLGDPAIQINYPVSRFNITKVNNTTVTGAQSMAQIRPLVKFAVDAQVVNENGTLDANFNGDATVTLYGKNEYFSTVTRVTGNDTINRPIYYNRDKLAEVTGRVVNGVFHAEMIAPMVPEVGDDTTPNTLLMRVYAHKDNSTVMVNGLTEKVSLLPYDESMAIQDNAGPVINTMFINDEDAFANGAVVAPEAILYITASDDFGINVQPNSIDGAMSLLLDDGRSTMADVYCYVSPGEDGKNISIEYPLANLAEGQHTLTYTVYDLRGNSTTRTITFTVGQTCSSNLVADKLPAYQDGEVNFDLETSLARTPEFIVSVTDATGKLVWKTETRNFPVAWDMKDRNGNTVPAGLYRYYGTYNDGTNYGGTPINKLIVLDPVKTAQ